MHIFAYIQKAYYIRWLQVPLFQLNTLLGVNWTIVLTSTSGLYHIWLHETHTHTLDEVYDSSIYC